LVWFGCHQEGRIFLIITATFSQSQMQDRSLFWLRRSKAALCPQCFPKKLCFFFI
jgi:hypothetical protein